MLHESLGVQNSFRVSFCPFGVILWVISVLARGGGKGGGKEREKLINFSQLPKTVKTYTSTVSRTASRRVLKKNLLTILRRNIVVLNIILQGVLLTRKCTAEYAFFTCTLVLYTKFNVCVLLICQPMDHFIMLVVIH